MSTSFINYKRRTPKHKNLEIKNFVNQIIENLFNNIKISSI